MTKRNANILVTRPLPKGRELVSLLEDQGMQACEAPLFAYQAYPLASTTPSADIFIFVSVAAVEYAHTQQPIDSWQASQFIGVGRATKLALAKLGISAISPTEQNSEGVLSLNALNQVQDKRIVIVRGDKGRELMFDTLTNRGANVSYLQSYQRLWRTFSQPITNQWRQDGINFIICTSVAMLEKMANLLVTSDNYWQKSCTWVVASSRIYEKAKQLELTHIILANGASNQELVLACQNGSNYDR